MGFRIWRDYFYLYVVEKEDLFIFGVKFLGVNLNSDGEVVLFECRRKRFVCYFDFLDIKEILNCIEEVEINFINIEG